MKRTLLALNLAAALLILSACQTTTPHAQFDPRDPDEAESATKFSEIKRTQRVKPEWLSPPTHAYRFGPGDLVEIEIADISGTLARTFIMPDGMVYYNLAGGVNAEGLTQAELAKSLVKALSRDYTAPMVNVSLVEVRSRRYWMLGRVSNPGIYPLSQPTTLLEAIAMAGGLFTVRFSGTTEELADLANSVVLRDGKILPVDFAALMREGDQSQNIYLRKNDFVYLPSSQASNVLILGAVRSPQSIGFKDSLSLIEAVAFTGGPLSEAHVKTVVIVRGSVSLPKAAVVDLTEILTGKDTDVALHPGDIVWIPRKPYRLASEVIDLVLSDAIRTVAVNEGASVAGSANRAILTVPSAAGSSGGAPAP